MKFAVFWETGSRHCVICAEDPPASGFAVVARGKDGKAALIAISAPRNAAEPTYLCCARVGLDVAECEIVDLDRPDAAIGRFRLVDAARDDAPWRAAFRMGDGGDAPVQMAELGSMTSASDIVELYRHTRARTSLDIDAGWLVAVRAAEDRGGAYLFEPCSLVWPPDPSIAVEAIADAREAPIELPESARATALLRVAYAPSKGLPQLRLTTRDPSRIDGSVGFTLVSIAHQVRFFSEKDAYLRRVNLPGIETRDLEFPGLRSAAEFEADAATRVLTFDWRAGATFFDETNPKPVIVEFSADAASAIVRFDAAALGDDLYVIAAKPLLREGGVGPLASILGFRVGFRGLVRLDLADAENRKWAREAEMAMRRGQGQGFGLAPRGAQRDSNGPSKENPLRGLTEAAFEAARRGVRNLEFSSFARMPALLAEFGRWRGGSAPGLERGAAANRENLALALAAAAGVDTSLGSGASVPRQLAVARALREGVRIDILRAARIILPDEPERIERAIAAAEFLRDGDRIEDAEIIAEDLDRGDLARRLRAFRSRAPGEWTALDDAESLAHAVRALYDEVDPPARAGEGGAARRPAPRPKAHAILDFERKLAAARAAGADAARLDALEAEYFEKKQSNRLDRLRTIPRLERALEALTAGPIIEGHFSRAILALERWAGLEDFSSQMLARVGQGVGEDASPSERVGVVAAQLRAPGIETTPSAWRDARRGFRDSVAMQWKAMNRKLRAEDVAEREAIVVGYADAMLHHAAYRGLRALSGRFERELSRDRWVEFANALAAWPQDAGSAWKIASQAPDSGLEALARAPDIGAGEA
jgi:hypothetical protein